ncbi:F-box protein At1g10780 [Linum perenne]
MDSLPDGVVQYIFTFLDSARDIAICNCVSKRWKDTLRFMRRLYFPRSAFEKRSGSCNEDPDTIVLRMIVACDRLEELLVYTPFTNKGLASWLVVAGSSLKKLELRMDNIGEYLDCSGSLSKVDCLNYARNLESLKLWGVLMTKHPIWDGFPKLQNLEIVGAKLPDAVLSSTLKRCPNLKTLVLLACEGNNINVSIDLPHLEECRLDFHGAGNCSLRLTSPKVEVLEVQGCSLIRVPHAESLKNLTISSNATGRVYELDFGRLTALESLTMRGVQWTWDAISKMLYRASEVKQLLMKIEFTGDFGTLDPFPEIDFVEFFSNHRKLREFKIHGAMFAALCNSLSNLESEFVIPSLEEVEITVRSPLKAEQKINTLESLLKYGKNLKSMKIRILQMQSSHESADDFFDDICKFQRLNHKIVTIE